MKYAQAWEDLKLWIQDIQRRNGTYAQLEVLAVLNKIDRLEDEYE